MTLYGRINLDIWGLPSPFFPNRPPETMKII